MRTTRVKSIAGLVVSLVVAFAAAAIGGMATQRAPELYATLSRPGWAPPSSVFGPVWSVLYALMAVAAWLVWKEKERFRDARVPLGLYGAQLALNALWSWLFFAWQRGLLAATEIVVLLVLIVATIVAFWRVRPVAGALMLPYLVWVTYAAALTFSLVRRNPGVL